MRHSTKQDDLTSLKDDMTAFIEGHGLRRFQGYVPEEAPSVSWEPRGNPDAWKDFVELAKAAGATFLTMNDALLEQVDVDFLVERLRNSRFPNDEDIEEARWLRTYIGKTGFVQLGWPQQGVMFLYEISTAWYDRYQGLLEMAEEFDGTVPDEATGADPDEER
ncbi:MAG: hypothetical protein ACRD2K_05485 [Terriglobales bacterium]